MMRDIQTMDRITSHVWETHDLVHDEGQQDSTYLDPCHFMCVERRRRSSDERGLNGLHESFRARAKARAREATGIWGIWLLDHSYAYDMMWQ